MSRRARLAVTLTRVLLASLLACPSSRNPHWAAIGAALALLAVDWRLWRYFAAERGWWFALRAVPMQWLYYLYSGAAFAWVLLTGDWRRQRAAPTAGARVMHVNPVLIAGAGPAGLTAALELSRAGVPVVVHEAESRSAASRAPRPIAAIASISAATASTPRSPRSSGCGTSCSAHELIRVPRLSRIFYQGRFYAYPLQLPNVVRNLGPGRKRADDVELPARAAAAVRSRRRRSRTGS